MGVKRQVTFSAKNLNRRLKRTVDAFHQSLDAAQSEAAEAATLAGRKRWKARQDRRPRVGPRPGRSTKTHTNRVIKWTPLDAKTDTGATFDVKSADRRVPHWFIHEIGTGKSAHMKRPVHQGRTGRPKKGASTVRRVKSQKGRKIKRHLVWSDGAPMVQQGKDERARVRRSGGGQLMLASEMGVPPRTRLMVIKKEINGKHFVMKGTTEGFRRFNTLLMAAGEKHWNTGP